ncbi:valine--tRNA ligase [bacterium]|nr:valine--tRNA ligase [bacterium]
MSDISKTYEPQTVEPKWYEFWDRNGCFTADPARVSAKRPAYSIVIPPPNVTGVLTLGHVLNNTIQDILARKARMDGKEVLWLPGTDHAGIATQNVVEKTLKKEGTIKHRNDLGREALVAKIWEWKEKYGGIILKQLRALGASCDWTRARFTMDPEYSKCVQKVFVDLYKKGLIYRGKRMVNWCPASLTALSDEEVTMKEQKGFLYYFRVQVVEKDGTPVPGSARVSRADSGVAPESPSSNSNLEHKVSGATPDTARETRALPETEAKPPFGPETDEQGDLWLTIATTRPETIPGDTAVAVNPKDPRYSDLIGKCVRRPLPVENQALLPIIGDEHIDISFGTGVLKVTPAHDKADFEIGQRHNLEVIEVINADGTMNDLAGKDLTGLDRFKARKAAAEKLTEIGSMLKEEPYTNNVGFSERADVPIEPRLSEQWFLKYPSVESSRDCVEQASDHDSLLASDARVSAESLASSGDAPLPGGPVARRDASITSNGTIEEKMHFHPERWAKVYDHWMGGIQDWCISRQLWWGHRIPVWTKKLTETELKQLQRNCISLRVDDSDEQCGFTVSFSGCSGHESFVGDVIEDDPGGAYLVCASAESPQEIAILESTGWNQDPDVLDTWFSSWLWPFATMGWTSDKKADAGNATLKAFYPTTDLVTGPDIIFFWVARMIMAGYEYMGDLPFRNVYFTGIIRDKQGRKMSKSLGNSPDPLDLINKYGADALRFGVMRSAPLGQDVLFDEKNIELGRNFCTKLWNACRFRQMVGQSAAGSLPAESGSNRSNQDCQQAAGSTMEFEGELDPVVLNTDDKWILLRLNVAIQEVTQAFAEYRFTDATATLYRFFWNEYCDWYLETTKAVLMGSTRVSRVDSGDSPESLSSDESEGSPVGETPTGAAGTAALPTDYEIRCRRSTLAVMDFVIGNTLRLFHPFLPFITEELWQGMGFNGDLPKGQGGDTIMFAHWPKPFDGDFRDHYGLDDCYLQFAENKYETVRCGRNLRSQFNIQSNRKVNFILKAAEELIPHDVAVLKLLLNAETLTVDRDYVTAKGVPMIPTPLGELYLPLAGLIDVEAEKARLAKELEKTLAEIEKVKVKLANPNFTQKVPPEVLREHEERLVNWQQREQQIRNALDVLG